MPASEQETLIFIHGWATDKAVWDAVAPEIAGKRPFLNVSLPGHGGPGAWYEPTLMPAKEAVLRLLDKESGPYVGVGWSLGAEILISLASQFPSLFKGLILTGATARFCADKEGSYGQSKALVRRMIMDMKRSPAETLQRFYSLNFTPEELATKGARGFIERYRYPGPVECRQTPPGCFPQFKYAEITTALEALYATDLTEDLGEIEAKTLLIHGRRDSVCPIEAGRALASAIKGSKLEVFDGAGHAPFVTEAERFASCAKGFLDGL